jgi:phosphatidylglycerophosphate synthase
VRIISKTGITPNQVSLFRGILNIASLILFALGDTKSLIYAFVIFQIFEILDHVDGDLARFKNLRSKLGLFLEWLIDLLESTMQGFLGLCVSIGIYRQTGDFVIFFVFIAITMGHALSPSKLASDSRKLEHAQYGDYLSVKEGKTFVVRCFRFIEILFLWQNQIILWAALLYYPINKYLHFNPLFWGMIIIAFMVQLNWLRKLYVEYYKTVKKDEE